MAIYQLKHEQKIQSMSSSHKAFSLTYVVYEESDPLGPIYALLSLAPPFCCCSLVTQIIVERDLRAAFLLCGLLTTSGLCTILKSILRQPRPMMTRSTFILPQSETGGMPSNHSSFVAFASTFSLCFAIYRCRNMQGPTLWVRRTKRWLPPAFVSTVALGCCYSRIHLGYHTPAQVAVGAVLGCCMGMIWFRLYVGIYQRSVLERCCWWSNVWDMTSPHDVADVGFAWKQCLDARRKLS